MCAKKHHRHLLPTNTTGELMHIDDGVASVQNLLGEEMDAHPEGEGNLGDGSRGPRRAA